MSNIHSPPFISQMPTGNPMGIAQVDSAFRNPGAPRPVTGFSLLDLPVSSGVRANANGLQAAAQFPQLNSGGGSTLYVNRSQTALTANATIPYHYLVTSPDGSNSISGASIGMMLFMRTQKVIAQNNRYSGSIYFDQNSSQALDWMSLCEWLADGENSDVYKSAEDVIKEWKFGGVIKVEVAPDTNSMYGTKRKTRMLNLVAGGRVSAINAWAGLSVMEGTPLYMIVKKRTRDLDSKKKRSREESDMVWTLEPYADSKKPIPSLENLMYYDENSKKRYGTYIYIGLASGQNSDSISAPIRGRMELIRRGVSSSMEVYVGV